MAHRSFSLPFVENILVNRRRKSSQSIKDDEQRTQEYPSAHPPSIRTTEHYDDEEDVEADVLFPRYDGEEDKADMAAFDEVIDRRTSNDGSTLKLSRTLSKRSRSYGDQHAMVIFLHDHSKRTKAKI